LLVQIGEARFERGGACLESFRVEVGEVRIIGVVLTRRM
jgi:hypothetical protein